MSHHSDTQPNSKARVLAFPEHKSTQTQASEWLAKLDAEQPSPQGPGRLQTMGQRRSGPPHSL